LTRRNVEIKAKVTDPDRVHRRVASLATEGPHEILQHDTFFPSPRGRLKLRRFADGSGELIAYRRSDAAGPTTSWYDRVPCADATALVAALGAALGVRGEVRKHRTLWLVGRARVHLDRVEGLGDFVEIEVVLGEDESEIAAAREADDLAVALGIDPGARIAAAYVDLLPSPTSVYSPANEPA
jgi:adenylate cyclase class IV